MHNKFLLLLLPTKPNQTMTVYITVIGGRCDIEQPDWSEGQFVVIDGLLGCGNILWDKRLSWGLLEGYPGCRVHGQAGTSCVVSTVMHPAMILKAMWHCLLTDCWTDLHLKCRMFSLSSSPLQATLSQVVNHRTLIIIPLETFTQWEVTSCW